MPPAPTTGKGPRTAGAAGDRIRPAGLETATLLARGIRSYHRPTRIEDALALAAEGAAPLAGGTRLLAAEHDVPNVLDLSALGLSGLRVDDEDLEIGALTPLEEVLHSPAAHAATAGLLPAACRASVPSRLLRGMATIGGEAIAADAASDLAAALLALNAVFVVTGKDETIESPGLRFLRDPALDLGGGALLRNLLIPGAPHGAALERAAALPTSPALVAVAATTTFSGDQLARVRIAVTGLAGRPARVPEAEAQMERTNGEEQVIEKAADALARSAPFRDDPACPAAVRRRIARALALRALRTAVERGRHRLLPPAPRPRRSAPLRSPAPKPYFTSGRLELSVNGLTLRADADARTTLLELLRGAGVFGAKSGCGTGRCGACTVLLDGRPIASCLTLAVRAQGRAVITVEGLGTIERPHPIQTAFAEQGAVQCGFCAPAMVLSARALLDALPEPTEEEVRDELSALCRCTGYVKPVAAVLAAASRDRA